MRIQDGKIIDEKGGEVGEVRFHLKERRFPVLRATVKGVQRDFDVDRNTTERIFEFASEVNGNIGNEV